MLVLLYAYTQTFEVKKGISETYRIEHYENGAACVLNVNNPLNLSEYNSLWHEKVKILSYKVDPAVFVKRHILPAVQNFPFDDDNDTFVLSVYISLDGKIQFIVFIFSSPLTIPVETIEEMEQAMKSESSFVLKFDPAKMDDTPYIMITSSYMLSEMLKYWTPPKPLRPIFKPKDLIGPEKVELVD